MDIGEYTLFSREVTFMIWVMWSGFKLKWALTIWAFGRPQSVGLKACQACRELEKPLAVKVGLQECCLMQSGSETFDVS